MVVTAIHKQKFPNSGCWKHYLCCLFYKQLTVIIQKKSMVNIKPYRKKEYNCHVFGSSDIEFIRFLWIIFKEIKAILFAVCFFVILLLFHLLNNQGLRKLANATTSVSQQQKWTTIKKNQWKFLSPKALTNWKLIKIFIFIYLFAQFPWINKNLLMVFAGTKH